MTAHTPQLLAGALCTVALGVVLLSGCVAPAQDAQAHAPAAGVSVESPPVVLQRKRLQQHTVRDTYADPSRITVVVNKRRPLKPLDYAPARLVVPGVPLAAAGRRTQLAPAAARAAEQMFNAAAAEGVSLVLLSGYRSFEEQHATYQHWLRHHSGDAGTTDTVSARPGYSEHQTGLAFDVGQGNAVCSLQPCFHDTAAAAWLRGNAHRFGLILRYPAGMHEVTGYHSEAWHYRYVGTAVAAKMKAGGILTLEDYYGLPPAPSYR